MPEIIDFDDHPVGFVGKIVPFRGPAFTVINDGVHRIERHDMRIDRKPEAFQEVERFQMRFHLDAYAGPQGIGEKTQPALAAFNRIEQF